MSTTTYELTERESLRLLPRKELQLPVLVELRWRARDCARRKRTVWPATSQASCIAM
jgi:hypothetical protein